MGGITGAAVGGVNAASGERPAIQAGASLDRYVVVGHVGRGGMGDVWSAWDPDLGRRVALKVLRRVEGDEARRVLFAEARALARLRHPNVVAVHDVGEVDGQVFLAMEFSQGLTLEAWLRQAPSDDERRAVLLQAGQGLAAAHAAGVVHGDFKPSNVMVERTPTGWRASIIDFGLARVGAEHGSDALGYTPAYAAPEVVQQRVVGPASDQWSYALTFCEALAGERPANADLDAERHPASARLGRTFRALDRALSPMPERRWPTVDALLDALQQDRRRRRVGRTAAVVAMAGAAVVGLLLRGTPPCADAEKALVGTYDDGVRAELGAALDAALPSGPDVRAPLVGALDEWTREWTAQRREVCMSVRVRGERSVAYLDDAMACLDRQRLRVAAIVEAAQRVRGDEAWALLDLADALDAPAACAVAGPAVDDGEAVAARESLERARAALGLDRFAEAEAEAARAVVESEAVDARVLAAEARIVLGEARRGQADTEGAREALVAASRVAIAEDVPRLAVQAIAQRLMLERWPASDAASSALAELGDALAERSGLAVARAELHHAWSVVARRGEDFVAAKGHCEQVLALLAAEPRHNRLRWSARLCVGHTAMRLAELDVAEAAFTDVRREVEATLGPRHPTLVAVYEGLGHLALVRDDLQRARELWQDGLALGEQVWGPGNVRTVSLLANLAIAERELGDWNGASEHLLAAHAISERTYGAVHPDTARASMMLGQHELARGDAAAALEWFGKGLAALPATPPSPDTRAALDHARGLALYDLGRFDEAVEAMTAALAVTRKIVGASHPETADRTIELAWAELAAGRPDAAARRVEQVAAIHEARGDATPHARARLELLRSKVVAATGGSRDVARRHGARALDLVGDGAPDDAFRRGIVAWLAELDQIGGGVPTTAPPG